MELRNFISLNENQVDFFVINQTFFSLKKASANIEKKMFHIIMISDEYVFNR